MTLPAGLRYLLLSGLLVAVLLWRLYRYSQERRYRRPALRGGRRCAPGLPPPRPLPRPGTAWPWSATWARWPTDGPDPVMSLLQDWLRAAGAAGTVVLLGDNVYPTGLPAPAHPGRAAAERRLNVQLDALRPFAGRVVFLSGNHDWNKGRRDGYEYLLRQEAYRARPPARRPLPATPRLPWPWPRCSCRGRCC